jgi:hypothetical protein
VGCILDLTRTTIEADNKCDVIETEGIAGSEAFLLSAQLNLDKVCGTARKKTAGDSGGAASLLMVHAHFC